MWIEGGEMSIVEPVPHIVMPDENDYQRKRPPACAFVKCSFVDILGVGESYRNINHSNMAQGNAPMAGDLTREANSVSIKTLLPSLWLIVPSGKYFHKSVPSWKYFHKSFSLPSFSSYCRDTSSRKPLLITSPTLNPPGQSTHSPVTSTQTACTSALDVSITLLIPVFTSRLWGSWGQGPFPSCLSL